MMVYLLRHGRAEPASISGGDQSRALTAAGAAELETSLRACAGELAPPDRILHSPYLRAQQTAEILARVLDAKERLCAHPGIVPGGSPKKFVEELASSQRVDALYVVSHEPFLGNLLGLLATGDPRSCIPMDVGTIAGIEIHGSTSMVGHLVFTRAIRHGRR